MPYNLPRQNHSQMSITPKPLKNWGVRTISALLMTVTVTSNNHGAWAQSNVSPADPQPRSLASSPPGEAAANTVSLPTQILRTGVNVEVNTVSANSLQLAEI